MNEQQFLADQFDANRTHLRAIAYRMLGSMSDTDDAIQEAWLRLSRTNSNEVENLSSWLTTVVARVCLDMLRSRKSRREAPLDEHLSDEIASQEKSIDPEHELMMAESVGLAMLVVLQALSPAERIAFVLHDMFDFPFEKIGPIVDRTPTAARQLASRARRRVQGKSNIPSADLANQQKIITAFLAASRDGNFAGLLELLDPDILFRADHIAQREGAAPEIRGAEAVAKFFLGRAGGARIALVDGMPGAVVAPLGELYLVLGFTFSNGKIIGLNAVADPERLLDFKLALCEGR